MALPDIYMLWIGTKLSPLEQCCMKSFVQNGHKVFLYAYNDFEDLPQGVTLLDASDIIEEEKVFRHRNGGLSIFSDFFRWKLLMKHPGVFWVDADVFCLKPFDFDTDYVLGGRYVEFGELFINNAIMKIPSDSPILHEMYELWDRPEKFLPHIAKKKSKKNFFHKLLGIEPRMRQKSRVLRLLNKFGIRTHISKYPFAISGPLGLTHYIQAMGLLDKVDLTNPFEKHDGTKLFNGEVSVDEIKTDGSYSLHFYQSVKNQELVDNPVKGSVYEWCLLSTNSH